MPRVVDLTHPLSPAFPLFPIYDPIEVAQRFSLDTDPWFVQRWSFDEHCGTHVDAPAHFAAGGATVDQVAVQDLVLELVVLDVREQVARDPDHQVSVDDLRRWESRHGALPDRCLVAALTGWAEKLATPGAFLGIDDGGTAHFPGFSGALAAHLLEAHPGVRGIGIDTSSLDHGASTTYDTHGTWLPAGRFGIENLARLDDVPPRGAEVVVGVPPLAGGSGAPARILGIER